MGIQRCSSLWQTFHSHPAALHNCKLENGSRFTKVTDRSCSRYKLRRGSNHMEYGCWGKLEAYPDGLPACMTPREIRSNCGNLQDPTLHTRLPGSSGLFLDYALPSITPVGEGKPPIRPL